MNDLCPFCAKPIMREYGSFRCKHCAKSSEDMIDLERKNRAAEVRKAARADVAAKKASAAIVEAKREAVALAVARHMAKKRAAAADPSPVAVAGATATAAPAPRAKKRPTVR